MKDRGTRFGAGLLAPILWLISCGPPPDPRPLPIADGERLAQLTDSERDAFLDGRAQFTLLRYEDGGLGPLYNGRSCVECHGIPQVGGTGSPLVIRAGFVVADGGFEAIAPLAQGGTLVPRFSIKPGVVQAQVHQGAVVGERRINPLFGAGLIEAIPDQTLTQLEAAPKPMGIRGRAHHVVDPVTGASRVGRFGAKAIAATVEGFAAKALHDELGITSPLFPEETVSSADPAVVASLDPVADPDVPLEVPAALAAFVRGLAPLEAPDGGMEASRGEQLFADCACNACHIPDLLTGPSDSPAFDRVRVPLYSDLLLHEIGSADGIAEGDATPTEIRTAPLWGLWARGALWHDKRASSVGAAIGLHGGEAAQSRAAFLGLSAEDQDAVVAFVRSR